MLVWLMYNSTIAKEQKKCQVNTFKMSVKLVSSPPEWKKMGKTVKEFLFLPLCRFEKEKKETK